MIECLYRYSEQLFGHQIALVSFLVILNTTWLIEITIMHLSVTVNWTL